MLALRKAWQWRIQRCGNYYYKLKTMGSVCKFKLFVDCQHKVTDFFHRYISNTASVGLHQAHLDCFFFLISSVSAPRNHECPFFLGNAMQVDWTNRNNATSSWTPLWRDLVRPLKAHFPVLFSGRFTQSSFCVRRVDNPDCGKHSVFVLRFAPLAQTGTYSPLSTSNYTQQEPKRTEGHLIYRLEMTIVI